MNKNKPYRSVSVIILEDLVSYVTIVKKHWEVLILLHLIKNIIQTILHAVHVQLYLVLKILIMNMMVKSFVISTIQLNLL